MHKNTVSKNPKKLIGGVIRYVMIVKNQNSYKKMKVSKLTNNLGARTSLSKVPLLGNILLLKMKICSLNYRRDS